MANKLVEVRNNLKSKKPTFKRQQSNQYAKFKNFDGWRRPKGLQSKMKLKRAGHRAMPSVGYGSPRAVLGLNKAGFREVLVHNVFDLSKVNSKTDVAIIARTVGGRKSIDILKAGLDMKLQFGNVFDVNKKIKELTKEPKNKVEKKVVEKKEEKSEKKSTAKKAESKEKEEAKK